MRRELEQRAVAAVAIAKTAGADDAWAGASRSRSVEFKVRDGILEEVKDSTSRSLGMRLFVDGRYSVHSTTDLRPERVEGFVKEAVALTRALQPDKYRAMPDPALFRGRPPARALDLFDASLFKLDRDQRIAVCQQMNSRVAGKDKVISATSGLSDHHSLVAAASSNGFTGSYESTSAGAYTSITLDDGEKRPEDWMGIWGRHVSSLPDSAGVADEALRRARARLGTTKGKTARTTMVVENRAAGRLIRRLLDPASGESVQQGRSFWRGKLGEKTVSDKLTVIDDPTLPRGLNSRPFDREGIAAKKLSIVQAGVFRNLYLDTYYANKLGMSPTTGDGSNRVIGLGTRSLDAIVGDVDRGVYVTSWLGGNVDSTTGDFSFGVRGHAIERGKLTRPVGEMNVTGNIVVLFGHLLELGDDPWPYSSTLAPTLVFDGVQFSGV